MLVLWSSLAGLMLYLELVYHFSGFGFSSFNPMYLIFLTAAWAGAETLLIGVLKGRLKKFCYRLFLWAAVIWTGAQLVYLRIFRQPLLWEAAFREGGEALTSYWRELLNGILGALPCLILFILPVPLLLVILKKRGWELPQFSKYQALRTTGIIIGGVMGCMIVLETGRHLQAEYYEDYREFYDPLTVAETMGVLPTLQRDTATGLARLLGEAFEAAAPVSEAAALPASDGSDSEDTDGRKEAVPESSVEISSAEDGSDIQDSGEETASWPETPYPQQFDLDYDLLHGLADNEQQVWLADYIQGTAPVNSNEYTGMFAGYNLIYLTAEGFSTYAVDEELTPTLYRLTHSGFVCENYYVPLWQTSTSDGEYINCTGLIPDGQFSMRKSAANNMAYTLPRFFAREGVGSLAYHNNSLSYYDRYLTHPNLGYDFKGCKLGKLSEEEWGSQIFPMEHPEAWPASDLEMMEGTLPEYLGRERFHVYYMTVSGHMYYNFRDNAMSFKNKEAVADLELSENARAYIACNIELDKALAYLLDQLEKAGQLERTVICLSADHYPYAMSQEQYEELAGKSLSEGKDLYRNSLILWNVGLEEEPVYIEKACGSMDIIPTLLNLFGFPYDSRMYAGRDILSDEEGLVIFNDRSFVTDALIYDKKGKETIWLTDKEGNDLISDEQKEAYLEAKKQEVKDRYQFSAYILREDYYSDVEQADRNK